MAWESDSPCCSHAYPRRDSGRELEFRDCGAIPGPGLLLTAERWIEGMWRRRLWWGMSVEEISAAMEARWYCWVTCGGWSYHHSLSPSACQQQQLNNRKAGPSNAWCTELQSRTPGGGPLYVPDAPNNREGPQAREPSKCLNGWSYGERLAKEAFWSPATRVLIKDSDRAMTPAVEAVHVPAHLAPPGPPQAKQLC